MQIGTRTLVAALAAASASLLACGGGNSKPEYAKDVLVGLFRPATQQTLSPNPEMGDSAQRERTQAPNAAAGDSSGGGRASRDSTKRP